MSQQDIKSKIPWALDEAWLKGNVDALDEIYAPDVVVRRPPWHDLHGLQALKQFIAGDRKGYSDIHGDYQDMLAEGDTVAYRYTMRMKHTGVTLSMPTMPPTGKELVLKGCVVEHLKAGKIIEEFEYSDYLGFLQQLGVVPPLG